MKFIKESLKNVRRLDDEPTDHDEYSSDELDFDLDGNSSKKPELDNNEPQEEPTIDDEFNLDQEPEEAPETAADNTNIDNIANRASEDPNRRGLIRTAKKAHLVYKREQESGTFEELWVYNAGDMKGDLAVRRAILAGTDIPTNGTKSPDGKQEFFLWTSGNVEFIKITGLPS